MLDQALKVVEAARALKLEKKGEMTGSTLDKLALAQSIDSLREAIEVFDRETGRGLKSPENILRPDFATPPQLDEEGFVERQELIEDAYAPGLVPSVEGDTDLDPVLSPQPRPENNEPSDFSPRISIPAMSAAAAMEYIETQADLGDMELNDGIESVADFLESLDAIGDKLEYAVARVGWTPRLRALAEAANIARAKMFLDVGHDGCYIRIPAESWSTLTVSIADAAMNMNNHLTIPVPKFGPKLDHEKEFEYEPKFRPRLPYED